MGLFDFLKKTSPSLSFDGLKSFAEVPKMKWVERFQSTSRDDCPYCGTIFDMPPQKKKKCQDCGNYVFVKQGLLYTEQGKADYEFAERCSYNLESTGITEDELIAVVEQTTDVHKRHDLWWGLLNKRLATLRPDRDFQQMQNIYWEMEYVLREEGRDTSPIQKALAQLRKTEFGD